MGDPGSTDTPRAAPPTTPGRLDAVPPAWPMPIGILAIVFASFGLISIVAGIAMLGWARSVSGMSYTAIGWATMALGFFAAVWHLVAGILTVRCSRRGPSNLIAWAWVNSVLVVLTTLGGVANMTATYAPGTAPPTNMMGFSYAMMVPGVLISLAWPIFLLIYLTRPVRKAQWKSWR